MLFIKISVDIHVIIVYNVDDRYWDEALSPHNWIIVLTRPSFISDGLLCYVIIYNYIEVA